MMKGSRSCLQLKTKKFCNYIFIIQFFLKKSISNALLQWLQRYKVLETNIITAQNAIFLEDANGQEGRPFKSRFLQAGLVKYDFGVCLLQKETIDNFVDTFIGCPVIIDHSDNIRPENVSGTVNKIWFSPEDGWFWCEGILTDNKAIELVESGYNVSCQYRITDYENNIEGKLHNGNPYDKEILNGVFEHLAIVENPRYEGAYIAVNAYIAKNAIARNENDNMEWITVKGNHIPIKDGQTKEQAVKEFIAKKGKSYEKRTEEKNKQISKDYALMRSKDFVKSIEEHPNSQKEIVFTNDDNTWLLVESWKKGEEGWDLVKAGKVIQHFNDRYAAYDAHDKGYFADVNAMDKEKTFDEKKLDIRPIKIKKSEVPQFANKKELSNWMKKQFEQLGSVKINDSGIDVKLSAGKANREAIKRRSTKDENKAVVVKFKEIVSRAIKKEERKADDRHNKDQEIYYNKFQIDGEDYDVEIFVDMPDGRDKNSYYAGHSATKIKIAPRDTMGAKNELPQIELSHHAKGATYSIPYLEIDFNPNITKYDRIVEYIQNYNTGGKMDAETKTVFGKLIDALKARNEADEDKEKDAANKAKNADEDKRKLIDDIAGMFKSAGADDELIRSAIAKLEKLAYDKSEDGTADNEDDKEEDKKAENEDDEPKDDKPKEEAENKCKNADDEAYEELKEKVAKEAENAKAKNSLDALKSVFFEGGIQKRKLFMTQKEGIELGATGERHFLLKKIMDKREIYLISYRKDWH